MNHGLRILAALCLTGLSRDTLAQQPSSSLTPPLASVRHTVADYDAELRRPDGRVEVDLMVKRLTELGVRTYYWLLWHAPTDWDDLKLFLPQAAKSSLEVWVYLVPPSESPPQAKDYSEPFRTDSQRWAEEIARLSLARGKTNVTFAFRLLDKQGVSNFGLRWRVRDVQVEGLRPVGDLNDIRRWVVTQRGAFDAGLGPRMRPGGRRFHLPFIVMTAGSEGESHLRHGDPATPERITEWVAMCLQAWREGKCDGVVTYCLDKQLESKSFSLVQKLFRQGRAGAQ
jgi:hypothetical protein